MKPGKQNKSIRRVARIAAVAAFLGVTSGQAPSPPVPETPLSPELRGFVKTVGPFRPFAWRTSAEFQYAPLGRADPEIGGPDFFNRQRAEDAVRRAFERDPTTGNLSAWATVLLTRSNPNEAVFLLKQGLQKDPGSPHLLNDLAVALALRYTQRGRAKDLIDSVEACEAAIAADPRHRPALFNRALLLTRVTLPSAAKRAWSAYLATDADSPWRAEAEAALRDLEEASVQPVSPVLSETNEKTPAQIADLVANSPQDARQQGDQLLVTWAKSALDGDPKIEGRTFMLLECLAELLQRRAAETSLRDETALIRQLANDPKSITTLARSHVDFDDGRRLYYQRDLDGSKSLLENAATGFLRTGSGWRGWAEFYLALYWYQQSEMTIAIQRLDDLVARTDPERHGALAARLQRALAISHAVEFRYSLALANYREAARLYQRLGEVSNAVRAKSASAEVLSLLGRSEEAWNEYLACILAAPQVNSVVGRREIYQGAAVTALQGGSVRWALHLQEESLLLARLSQDPENIANSLGWEAGILLQLGRGRDARRDLVEAQGHIRQIPDESTRKDYEAQASLALGEVLAIDDPVAAGKQLERAAKLLEETRFQARLPTVFQAQAQVFMRTGQADRATAVLRRALDLIELSRQTIPDAPFQISFLDEQRAAFDSLVEIEFGSGETSEAFSMAERAKARSLVDTLRRAFPEYGSSPPALSGLAADLADDEVLIDYFLTAKSLFAWRVSAAGATVYKLSAESLPSLWEQFNLAIEYRSERLLNGVLEELYSRLAAPVFEDVKSGSKVVVAVDSFLGAIPFAALRKPESGRFLVEDYRISVLPSATLLPLIRRRIGELAERPSSLLAVGNPKFSRLAFPNLPDLPGAEREAEEAANLYHRSQRLLGEMATKREFLRLFSEFEVVHVAGHAIVNPQSGEALLLFADDSHDPQSGVLRGSEMARLSAPATRLVVLSGCRTAGGEVSRSEGALAIYRPLLAAGVPAVLASLWSVGDRPLVKLFRGFHVRVAKGVDPATALREAQLESLRDGSPVFDWGGLQLFGL